MKLKLLACAAALTLAACATPSTGPDATARFDRFEYASGAVDFSSYDQVFIAPITASDELKELVGYRPMGPSDTKRPITLDDLGDKAEDLDDEIRTALGGVVELVGAGGPGILTLEVEMTKLEANRPTQADMIAEPSLSLQSVYAGKAEVMVTFSENGRVLATAVDGDYPTLNDTLPPAPIWSTVNQYYSRLARKLADLMS